VNVSRGISGAAGKARGDAMYGPGDVATTDLAERLATAAQDWATRLRVAI
jgi:hypothetical protein